MESRDLVEMDLVDIAMLVEMADGKNLGEVAEVLGLSASAVSHRLGRLQARMPFPVTRRSGRDLIVTEHIAGAIPFLKSALQNLRDATHTMHTAPSGATAVGIARILSGWAETLLPEVASDKSPLRWKVYTGTSEEIVDGVRKGNLDAGLVRTDHGFWGVELHVLDQDVLVAVAAPTLIRTLVVASPETWPWIRFDAGLSHGQTVNQVFSHMEWRQISSLEVDALESALALVLVGRGVAVLPKSLVAHHLATSRLAVIPIHDVIWPTRTVAFVTRRGRPTPPWLEVWSERITRRLHHREPT